MDRQPHNVQNLLAVRTAGWGLTPTHWLHMPQLDNILLHGDAPAILKLCDFGYSKDGETESDCKTACGTPEYMAPEVTTRHERRDQNEVSRLTVLFQRQLALVSLSMQSVAECSTARSLLKP